MTAGKPAKTAPMTAPEKAVYVATRRQYIGGQWLDEGDTLELTETEARYRVAAGTLAPKTGASKPAPEKTTAKDKG